MVRTKFVHSKLFYINLLIELSFHLGLIKNISVWFIRRIYLSTCDIRVHEYIGII